MGQGVIPEMREFTHDYSRFTQPIQCRPSLDSRAGTWGGDHLSCATTDTSVGSLAPSQGTRSARWLWKWKISTNRKPHKAVCKSVTSFKIRLVLKGSFRGHDSRSQNASAGRTKTLKHKSHKISLFGEIDVERNRSIDIDELLSVPSSLIFSALNCET